VKSAAPIVTAVSRPEETFAVPTLYQGGRWRAMVRFSWALLGVVAVLQELDEWRGYSTLTRELLIAAVVVIAAACDWRYERMGLRFLDDGIELIRLFGSERIPYRDIAEFKLLPTPRANLLMHVYLRDGRVRRAPSMILTERGPFKTDVVRWNGHATTDVVGRLERHLDWARANTPG
jgi:hypothetical protein